MKRVVLVGNPTAQSGANAERIDRASALLRQRGLACEVFPTLPGGRTVPALQAALAASPPDLVVAMGGDGTFREVGAALLASGVKERVAMGMLPTGTANDQGKSFGLSAGESALEANVDVVAAGRETRLDAVHVTYLDVDGAETGRAVLFDSIGWGFSARVLLERNLDRGVLEQLGPLKLLYRDHMVYAGAMARVFMDSFVRDQTFDVTLTVDGVTHRHEGLTDLVVKNTRIYAGAWVLDRASRPDDGVVELMPFRNQADWLGKAIVDHDGNPLPEALRDPGGWVKSDVLRGSTIELSFSGAVLPLAQIDGEEADPSPRARVVVEPRALRLVVPQAHATT
jgi:diacylglycerol kinase family enzyme